ncbi:MAG: SDR family oxidoreductase [Candidatus Omnitrophota bacterium]
MTALVTGASGGIGYELAVCLARGHYDLVLAARSREKLEAIAADLRGRFQVSVHVIAIDLSVKGSSRQLYEWVGQRGLLIDVLVNNAGFGDWGPFVDADPCRQEAMVELNITALTLLTRMFLPGMVQRRSGRILNVASTAAFQAGPLMSVYFATKAFVLSFSRALASELKGSGVTVTCLCPGPTASGFQQAAFTSDILLNDRRMPSSREVAEYGYKALRSGQFLAVHGFGNRVMVACVRFLPQAFVLAVVSYVQSKKQVAKREG